MPTKLLPFPSSHRSQHACRPNPKVYGIEWDTRREPYSVYSAWNITDEQLVEMETYDGIKGVRRCCI